MSSNQIKPTNNQVLPSSPSSPRAPRRRRSISPRRSSTSRTPIRLCADAARHVVLGARPAVVSVVVSRVCVRLARARREEGRRRVAAPVGDVGRVLARALVRVQHLAVAAARRHLPEIVDAAGEHVVVAEVAVRVAAADGRDSVAVAAGGEELCQQGIGQLRLLVGRLTRRTHQCPA